MRKRYIIYTAIIIVAIACVSFFLYKNLGSLTSVRNIVVAKTTPIEVSGIEKRKIDFTPIVSATLYSDLKDKALPISFSVQVYLSNNEESTDTLYAGFESQGERLIAPLSEKKLCGKTENGSLYEYLFCYELSQLSEKKRVGVKLDILSFLKQLPDQVEPNMLFVGNKEEAGKFELLGLYYEENQP